MAIQIWSDGQYKSVDLAQYGADGTLSGAYIWRDGAWRTLWEREPDHPYPLTGTWSGTVPNPGAVLTTHTVTHDGNYAIKWVVESINGNEYVGQAAYVETPRGFGESDPVMALNTRATVDFVVDLFAGDLIEFSAGSFPESVTTGSWSIVKN